MKIAYFDCFSGISGDMVLGAFLDLGLPLERVKDGLSKLKLKGYEIGSRRVRRGSIYGRKFDCLVKNAKARRLSHRTLKDILQLIKESRLKITVKELAKYIFMVLAGAEAEVHGIKKIDDVHFHEVGDVDSIVDIVGTAIAVDELGIDKFYSSKVVLGQAYANTQTGILPVPSPATLSLLKGVPVSISRIDAELVTPTGAAILKSLASDFGEMPLMRLSGVGYGAGARDLKNVPNTLRILIGETATTHKHDRIKVIETNIDDMSPQLFDYLYDRLFKEGALDVFVTPVQMKKSRPGFKLTVLAEGHLLDRISDIIFGETTTIGLRYYEVERTKLERKTVKINTRFGPLRVKMSTRPDGADFALPEYDDCVKIARSQKVPLKVVYDEILRSVPHRAIGAVPPRTMGTVPRNAMGTKALGTVPRMSITRKGTVPTKRT